MTFEFHKSPYEFFEDGCSCDDCPHGAVHAADPHVRCKLYRVDARGRAQRLKMDICGTCLEYKVYLEDPHYKRLVAEYEVIKT